MERESGRYRSKFFISGYLTLTDIGESDDIENLEKKKLKKEIEEMYGYDEDSDHHVHEKYAKEKKFLK